MHAHRSRTTTSLVLLAVVFLIIGAVSTIDRIPAGGELQAQQTSWRGLVVAPEHRCSPYDADDHRYPQSVEDRIVAELGGVYGPYTGRWFASESDTDIEHMVARSEAHDSGLCATDLATRRRFATDLLNLTLAGPRVNRYEKVDRDAAEWLPAQNRCWFAARVIAVRQRYGLTIDRREADALDQVLAGCVSVDLIMFARGEVPATAAPAVSVSLSRFVSAFASTSYGPWFRSDLQSVPQHSVLDMGTFANSTVLLKGGAGGATSPLGPLCRGVFRSSAYRLCVVAESVWVRRRARLPLRRGLVLASLRTEPVCARSPRVRGSPRLSHRPLPASGSIPACAGKPSVEIGIGAACRVHPRTCGVDGVAPVVSYPDAGPSGA